MEDELTYYNAIHATTIQYWYIHCSAYTDTEYFGSIDEYTDDDKIAHYLYYNLPRLMQMHYDHKIDAYLVELYSAVVEYHDDTGVDVVDYVIKKTRREEV